MENRVSGPIRDKSPCMGCTREEKCPGCHDRCGVYQAWRQKIAAANEKRREYQRQPFSKIC